MKKEAKKTLLFLVVLVASFLAIDWLFGVLSYKLLASMPAAPNEVARMNYQVTQCESECLILGSSRASHHYAPLIIQDSLGLSTYNAGRNGHGISYADGVLRAIINRKKPKLIVLECSDGEFRPDWTEKVSSLKPYFKEYPDILRLAKNVVGDNESFKSKFSAYRFNSLLFPVLGTYLKSSVDKEKGFMPLKGNNVLDMKLRESKGAFSINYQNIEIFEDFVGTCRANNIKVVAFCSPIYQDFSCERIELSKICEEKVIPFFDYSNDEYFMSHPELFWDNAHLNKEGAEIYTKKIVDDIRKIIE